MRKPVAEMTPRETIAAYHAARMTAAMGSAENTTMEGLAFVRKLLAHRDAEIRKNERRKKKRLGKRLAAAVRIVDPEAKAAAFGKIWRSVTPPGPKFDRNPQATQAPQAKLPHALFHYPTLA